VLAAGFKVLGHLGYRRLLLLERLLVEPVNDIAGTSPSRVSLLGESTIEDYLAFRADAVRADIQQRWQGGDLCFAAEQDGRIVSACWVGTRRGWTEFLRCEIPLEPGDAYLYDAFTLPAYRGSGLAPAVCQAQLRHLSSEGYRRAVRGTVPENRPALRAHAKSGFRPFAMLVSVRVGPLRRHFRRESGT